MENIRAPAGFDGEGFIAKIDGLHNIQDKKLDLSAGKGIAIREAPTTTGPCDYLLLVDRKPVGVIEARKPARCSPASPTKANAIKRSSGECQMVNTLQTSRRRENGLSALPAIED